MYLKIALNLLGISFLTAIQFSFISGLPLGLNNLNLILVVLIFIIAVSGLKFSLWWAAGAGFLMDVFSFLPFGTYLLSLAAISILIYFSLKNFFTDRSLYSFLALAVIATFSYGIFMKFASYLMHFFGGNDFFLILNKKFWINELYQLALNLISVSVIFYFFNLLSTKLKPVFLIRKK